MNRSKFYIFVFIVTILTGCSRVQPIRNIENTPVVYNLQVQQVKTAIVQSAINRGWSIEDSKPHVLIAKINVRNHMAEIKIPYDNKYYSIVYLNSSNLKADNGNIHRNYNRWINNLNMDIQRAITLLGSEAK
ncbi:TPA: hypothetical protein ACX6QU_000147 [Photobacterium damselae]